MRIVFMGTAEFGIPSLKLLLEQQFQIVGVVTNVDKPSGRGQKVSVSPIKEFSLQHSLPVFQPVSLKDSSFIQQLQTLNADVFVVVAFRILPAEVFRLAKMGAFNLHTSLLPKYRGAAPIQWTIINGEKETGVTTFFLDDKVDTGNIILQARLPISEDETAGELHDRLAEVGAELVLHTVRLIEMGNPPRHPQNNSLASPAPKLFKEHCEIDWTKSAGEVHNRIRGLSPVPCSFTFHHGKVLKLYRSTLATDVQSTSPSEVLVADKRLVIATADGAVEILELQQEGKRKMSAEEFLRGYKISIGEKLGL
ncbi:MAG: methionyl-tRNA formyltransferase [Ignavibacteriales bacterium]|nr:methionyl-tRNA formyltransferase [Ignavibacteriales bacterium]